MVFWVNCGFFGGVRHEVRVHLGVSTLRHTSCVYGFPLHLLGLQSKCTEGLSTGALGEVEQGTADSC